MSHSHQPEIDGHSLNDVESASFSARVFLDEDRLDLTLAGSADFEIRPKLAALLAAVHGAAREKGIKEVHVQLKELVFINSSCLKELVTWILNAQEAEESQSYRIHLHVKKTLAWQTRALRPLVAIGQSQVVLDS